MVVLILKIPGQPHKCPRGAHRRHHGIYLTIGLGHDFRSCSMVMGLPVGLIIILIRKKIFVRVLPGQAVGLFNGPVRSQVPGGKNNLGTPGFEYFFTLLTGAFGHGQGQFVALDRTDHGKTDSRISRSGFNNGLFRRQFAVRLGLTDHIQGGPVFDGPTRVHVFKLGQDGDTRHRIKCLNFYKGGLAD